MKKIVLSIAVSSMLAVSSSGGWIDDAMDIQGTDDGFYKTQTRGVYSLGSKQIRFREAGVVIQPFHVTPPRFNVGCGGIDLTMGAFAYLDREFLIEKLKALSAAAPAFVYQMAISALCKDCQNILNELEKIANFINGLNFDTCDAIQFASNAGKVLGEGMNTALNGGESSSWMSKKLESGREKMQGWKDTVTGAFGGDSAKADKSMSKMVPKGSFLDMVIKETFRNNMTPLNLLGLDPDGDHLIVSSIRAAIGDLIGSEDPDGQPTASHNTGNSEINYFKTIFEGGKLPYISYSPSTKKIVKVNDFQLDEGALDIIKNKLKEIFEKMKNKQSLDGSDQLFLSSLNVPVYRYLNISVITKSSAADFDILAAQIAAEQTKNLVLHITNVISRGISSYLATENEKAELSEEAMKAAKNMMEKLNNINTSVFETTTELHNDLIQKKSLLDTMREKEQQVKSKLSMFNYYN